MSFEEMLKAANNYRDEQARQTQTWVDANSRNWKEASEMTTRRVAERRAWARAMIEEGYREIVKDAMLYGTGMPTLAWDEGTPGGDYTAAAMAARIGGKNYVFSGSPVSQPMTAIGTSSGANDPAIDMLNNGMRRVMEDRARAILGVSAAPPPKPPPPRKEREPLVRPRLLEVDDTSEEIV